MNTINNINNNRNINFTARMDISKVKNKAEWKEISKLFAEKTPRTPLTRIEIEEFNDGTMQAYCTRSSEEISLRFSKKKLNELLLMPKEKVVSLFKKVTNLIERNEKIYKNTQRFIDTTNIEVPVKESEKIWDAVVSSVKLDTVKTLGKDKFLGSIDIDC